MIPLPIPVPRLGNPKKPFGLGSIYSLPYVLLGIKGRQFGCHSMRIQQITPHPEPASSSFASTIVPVLVLCWDDRSTMGPPLNSSSMSSKDLPFVSGYRSAIIGMHTRLKAIKMKYVLLPMFWIPTGQTWATTIEPIDPPDAAKLRPRARRFCGKISEPYTQDAGPKPSE